jgi:hypothetical protein
MGNVSRIVACTIGVVVLSHLGIARAQFGPAHFADVTDAAGLGGDAYAGVTNHALGANWIDFNRDTWPDLFFVNGKGFAPHLFRNDGDGTFTRVDGLLPALPNVELMGSVFADVDNDGDDDLYVFTDDGRTNVRAGPPNLLLQNRWVENGGRVVLGEKLFVDVAAQAGADDLLETPHADGPAYRSVTGAALDYDRDGFVDLFVCHWIGFAHGLEGHAHLRDRLYRNRGDGTFADVTTSSGLNDGTDPTANRPCLAAVAAHLDDDLWPDLWVGNIEQPLPYKYDQIFHNQAGTGTNCADARCLVDVRPLSPGVGDDDCSAMGIAVGDPDLDGDWDVYITDLYPDSTSCEVHESATPIGNPLYLHTGVGLTYTDNSAAAAGVVGVGSWGTNFFDADQDGYEDLFVDKSTQQVGDFLFRNDGDGTFTDIGPGAGLTTGGDGRGSALADYDKDGDLDLVQVNDGGGVQLWQNVTMAAGHWLTVRPVATTSNRTALGTVVRITTGGQRQMRQVQGSTSAHSQDEVLLHFGLGAATMVDHVQVLWPSGIVTDLYDQPADTALVVVENAPGNQPPVVAITTPVEFTAVAVGAPLTFVGTAVDPEDGDLAAVLAWTSDHDGAIGTGPTFSTAVLREGLHRITAQATDSGAASGTYTATVVVGNAPPTVRVTSPLTSSSYRQGDSVPLTATAFDFEDGDLSANLAWTSDLDGPLGSGATLAVTTLSIGTHTITATVADGASSGAADTVQVEILPSTFVFPLGTKLLVKQKKDGGYSLALLAKDPAVTDVDGSCAVAGELVVRAAGAASPALRIPLDAAGWAPIKASKPALGCKYAGGAIRSLQLKRGKQLKLSAQASDLGVPLATDPRPVRIEVTHGALRHCFEFGGTKGSHKPGKKLLASKAAAASACP